MLSHRENVRTSKFWRKSKEKKQIFFENLPREYKDLILVKKKFKIFSCLCTFKLREPFTSRRLSLYLPRMTNPRRLMASFSDRVLRLHNDIRRPPPGTGTRNKEARGTAGTTKRRRRRMVRRTAAVFLRRHLSSRRRRKNRRKWRHPPGVLSLASPSQEAPRYIILLQLHLISRHKVHERANLTTWTY